MYSETEEREKVLKIISDFTKRTPAELETVLSNKRLQEIKNMDHSDAVALGKRIEAEIERIVQFSHVITVSRLLDLVKEAPMVVKTPN